MSNRFDKSNRVPENFNDLTVEWLNYSLQKANIIKKQSIESVEIISLFEKSKGFIGQLGKLHLTYSNDNQSGPKTMIVKLSSSNPEMREIGQEYSFYSREVNFYKNIAPNLNMKVPKCYYAAIDSSGEFHVILLEDLSRFTNGSRVLGCPISYAKQVVIEIAQLHASWWNNQQLFTLDWLPDLNTIYEFSTAPNTFQFVWEVFKEKAGGIPHDIIAVGDRYSNYVISVSNYLFQTQSRTLIHFDYHLDNLFFNDTNDQNQIITIDWQLITRGKGTVDLAFFIGQNLNSKIQREYETSLIQLYHQTLLDNGVQHYSLEECFRDYQIALFYHLFGLVYSIGNDSFTSEQDRVLLEYVLPRNINAIKQQKINTISFLEDLF